MPSSWASCLPGPSLRFTAGRRFTRAMRLRRRQSSPTLAAGVTRRSWNTTGRPSARATPATSGSGATAPSKSTHPIIIRWVTFAPPACATSSACRTSPPATTSASSARRAGPGPFSTTGRQCRRPPGRSSSRRLQRLQTPCASAGCATSWPGRHSCRRTASPGLTAASPNTNRPACWTENCTRCVPA